MKRISISLVAMFVCIVTLIGGTVFKGEGNIALAEGGTDEMQPVLHSGSNGRVHGSDEKQSGASVQPGNGPESDNLGSGQQSNPSEQMMSGASDSTKDTRQSMVAGQVRAGGKKPTFNCGPGQLYATTRSSGHGVDEIYAFNWNDASEGTITGRPIPPPVDDGAGIRPRPLDKDSLGDRFINGLGINHEGTEALFFARRKVAGDINPDPIVHLTQKFGYSSYEQKLPRKDQDDPAKYWSTKEGYIAWRPWSNIRNESTFVAGAVDHEGTYFYGRGGPYGKDAPPDQEFVVYTWNADDAKNTDKATGRPIMRIRIPGHEPQKLNGDFAFDSKGNLFLVIHTNTDGQTTTTIVKVSAETVLESYSSTKVPVVDGEILSSRKEARSNHKDEDGISAFQINGVAFDSDGFLYVSGNREIRRYNFATMNYQVARVGNYDLKITDLASCSTPPTVSLKKDLPEGRDKPGDQFKLSIEQGDISSSTVTRGNNTGVQSSVAGPIPVTAGQDVTISEAAADSGVDLSSYKVTAKCIDEANGNEAVSVSGYGPSQKVIVPTGRAKSPHVVCTLKNVPKRLLPPDRPEISLKKNLPNGRVNPHDQFKLSLTSGRDSVFAVTKGHAKGIQAEIAGPMTVPEGKEVTISEAGADGSGTNLDKYAKNVECWDIANKQALTVFGDGASRKVTIPSHSTNSPHVECTFVNTPELPTFSLKKNLPNGRFDDKDQFKLILSSGERSASAVTKGNTTGIQSEFAGPLPVPEGVIVQLSEEPADGTSTDLEKYQKTVRCVDEANEGYVAKEYPSPGSAAMRMPQGRPNSPRIVCTFTNTVSGREFIPPILPLTGGVGTDGFLAVGGLLVTSSCALVTYLSWRRRKSQNL